MTSSIWRFLKTPCIEHSSHQKSSLPGASPPQPLSLSSASTTSSVLTQPLFSTIKHAASESKPSKRTRWLPTLYFGTHSFQSPHQNNHLRNDLLTPLMALNVGNDHFLFSLSYKRTIKRLYSAIDSTKTSGCSNGKHSGLKKSLLSTMSNFSIPFPKNVHTLNLLFSQISVTSNISKCISDHSSLLSINRSTVFQRTICTDTVMESRGSKPNSRAVVSRPRSTSIHCFLGQIQFST